MELRGSKPQGLYLVFFLIRCLNFKTAKLSSIEVSVSVVCRSSSKMLAIISPLFRMRLFCSPLSWMVESSLIFRDSSLILEKVSMMAIVVCVATGLFKMVASMYKPFSVKALGRFTLPPLIEVDNFDFKASHSFRCILLGVTRNPGTLVCSDMRS